MAYSVLIKNAVAATDIASYNRYAVSGSTAVTVDIENGWVFQLATQNNTVASGYEEVWDVQIPQTGSLTSLWMACTEKSNITTDGSLRYSGLNDDPRKFINSGSYVFDAFKPMPGDIVTLTADAFSEALASNTWLNATNGYFTLVPGTTPTDDALSLKYLVTTYISIGSGAVDNQRVTAYKFVVTSN